MDYKPLYFHLFNALTDALERLNDNDILDAKVILMTAQRETEAMYMDGDEEN